MENEQIMIGQIVISSVVTLLVAMLGMASTLLSARAASKYETQKAIVLRFVEMFEAAIQAIVQTREDGVALCEVLRTVVRKEALSSKYQQIMALAKKYGADGCAVEVALFRLIPYMHDSVVKPFSMRDVADSIVKFQGYLEGLDRQMRDEGRVVVTDGEYADYRAHEPKVLRTFESLQERCGEIWETLEQRYRLWRKANLPFLKDFELPRRPDGWLRRVFKSRRKKGEGIRPRNGNESL